ncbi:hypothetical protein ON010_g12441 [Phytophthora cinnamomi]|nr:hypothetical protein ON010_g12441 [Phytophthora cinnamomi]
MVDNEPAWPGRPAGPTTAWMPGSVDVWPDTLECPSTVRAWIRLADGVQHRANKALKLRRTPKAAKEERSSSKQSKRCSHTGTRTRAGDDDSSTVPSQARAVAALIGACPESSVAFQRPFESSVTPPRRRESAEESFSSQPRKGDTGACSERPAAQGKPGRLRGFLSADDEELADYIPSRTAHRKLAGLLESLRDVESVSKCLQDDGLVLLDARDLCDALIEIQPSFAKYLVLAGDAILLTEEERATLEPFKLVGSAVVPEPQAGTAEGFAERVLKCRKVRAAPPSYALIEAIPPTSNVVERLFSVARAVLRHERHRLSPMMIEMILFLKINSRLWNVEVVEQCL